MVSGQAETLGVHSFPVDVCLRDTGAGAGGGRGSSLRVHSPGSSASQPVLRDLCALDLANPSRNSRSSLAVWPPETPREAILPLTAWAWMGDGRRAPHVSPPLTALQSRHPRVPHLADEAAEARRNSATGPRSLGGEVARLPGALCFEVWASLSLSGKWV